MVVMYGSALWVGLTPPVLLLLGRMVDPAKSRLLLVCCVRGGSTPPSRRLSVLLHLRGSTPPGVTPTNNWRPRPLTSRRKGPPVYKTAGPTQTPTNNWGALPLTSTEGSPSLQKRRAHVNTNDQLGGPSVDINGRAPQFTKTKGPHKHQRTTIGCCLLLVT